MVYGWGGVFSISCSCCLPLGKTGPSKIPTSTQIPHLFFFQAKSNGVWIRPAVSSTKIDKLALVRALKECLADLQPAYVRYV